MNKNLLAAAALSLGLATGNSALAQSPQGVKKLSDTTALQTSEVLSNAQAMSQTIEVTPELLARFSVVQSNLLGTIMSGGVIVGFANGNAAASVDVRVGKNEREILTNLGFKITENSMVRFSFQDLKQYMDFAFQSGEVREQVSQNTFGATLRIKNVAKFIEWLEFSGYHIDAPSKMLSPKEYYIDTPTLYQLWEDQRRIAGAKKTGVLGTARISVSQSVKLELSLGYENEKIDYINKPESNNHITAKTKVLVDITDNLSVYAGVGSNLATTGEVGLTYTTDGGTKISPAVTYVRGQNGMKDNIMTGVRLEIPLDPVPKKVRKQDIPPVSDIDGIPEKPYSISWSELPKQTRDDIISGKYVPAPRVRDLIEAERNGYITPREVMDFVGTRPLWMPYMVNARVDTSLQPKLLVEIDPAGLPAGSKINLPNGDISLTFPFAVGALVSAVNNTNGKTLGSETFTLSGNNITIHTRQLEKYLTGPNLLTLTTTNAVVVIDAYNGSVHIKSITLQSNVVDTPPSVLAPTVAKTDTTATLTNGISDADGVRNITYYIYSDAGATNLVAQNTTGSFTGLTGSTTYYARTSAEVRNNVTNAWALQTSGLRTFTTDAPAVTPLTWGLGVTNSYPGNRLTNPAYSAPGVICIAEEANLSSCGLTVNSMSGTYTTADIQSVTINNIGPMTWSQVSPGYYNLYVPGAATEQSGTGTITLTLTNGQTYSNNFNWFVDQLGVGIGN